MARAVATFVFLMVFACSVERGSRLGDSDSDSDPDRMDEPEIPRPELPRKPANCSAAPSEDTNWDNAIASRIVSALGSAYHGTADAMTNPGRSVTIEARFVYGIVLKDLENETIIAWLEQGDCEWIRLSEARTDSDGSISFVIDADLLTEPGAYNFELAVRGDDSRVRGTIWIDPSGTEAVVFDIDGTLTTGDDELVKELLLGSEPSMYEAADQVVTAYVDAGYRAVYVTGRPLYLDIITREWLSAHGFPAGPLHLTQGFTEAVSGVEQFKSETLLDLRARVGLELTGAYGNATTDICAYASAGIDPSQTFIIGDNAGKSCGESAPTVAIDDYPSHLAELEL